MDCISMAFFCHFHNGIHFQVTFVGWGWPNIIGLVRKSDVHGTAVGLRKYCNRSNAHFTTGAHNTDSNFPSVCNKYFFYHKM